MTTVAFSYLRFSSPEQAAGDSFRRQMAMAEKYTAEHGLTLDRTLTLRDLGVSAYRSTNAKEGALRAFLEAIEHGLVPLNSYLLIESLDRLSRDRVLAAQALFLRILEAGVVIVTLGDQRVYSFESLNQNPLDLIISIVSMMRAYEESETKSQRIRAVFAEKRANLATKPWSAKCPGWLRLDKAKGKFIVIKERADVVRGIYRDALAGVGHQTIALRLNKARVPLFGHGNQKGKLWQRSLIRHFLRTPTVIGTHVPFITEYCEGVRRMRPQPAVENYYPAIIRRTVWDRVQEMRTAWGERYHLNVPKTGRRNLLAGLSSCPYCDRAMVLLAAGKPEWRYLECRMAYYGVGCSDHWVRYPAIDELLTAGIEKVIESCPEPAVTAEIRDHMLDHIARRLRTLRSQRASMVAEHKQIRQSGRAVMEARLAVEGQIERLLEERMRLREDRPRWLDLTLMKRLDKLRAVALAGTVDRKELHSILKSLLTKVIVDWENNRLIFHWKHGGESLVKVDMRPLRKSANKRRADRPRYRPGEMAPALPVAMR